MKYRFEIWSMNDGEDISEHPDFDEDLPFFDDKYPNDEENEWNYVFQAWEYLIGSKIATSNVACTLGRGMAFESEWCSENTRSRLFMADDEVWPFNSHSWEKVQ